MDNVKRVKVIMLPTETAKSDYHQLWLCNRNHLYNATAVKGIKSHKDTRFQELYIISDDEIKEGDWFVSNNIIYQASNFNTNKNSVWSNEFPKGIYSVIQSECKKIIATTDTSLIIKKQAFVFGEHYDEFILPQPSQQFITKYIESYNKGEVITDVLVEYEKATYDKWFDNGGQPVFNTIKVNPKDNTITIKKLKDSWNKEEHRINIMHCLSLFAAERGLTPTSKEMKIVNEWSDKWCNENL